MGVGRSAREQELANRAPSTAYGCALEVTLTTGGVTSLSPMVTVAVWGSDQLEPVRATRGQDNRLAQLGCGSSTGTTASPEGRPAGIRYPSCERRVIGRRAGGAGDLEMTGQRGAGGPVRVILKLPATGPVSAALEPWRKPDRVRIVVQVYKYEFVAIERRRRSD